jgi:hypothetical protein
MNQILFVIDIFALHIFFLKYRKKVSIYFKINIFYNGSQSGFV